jgi:tetratricopeptide (TPR) repeat protein
MKIATAKNGSIAAAGDINITFTINDRASSDEIIREILRKLSIDPGLITSLSRENEDRSAEEKISSILMVAKSSAFDRTSSYDAYFAEVNDLEMTINAAIKSLQDHDYLKAHGLFRAALESDPADKVKPRIVYDYFVSGYVGYSLVSDVDAIRGIISELRSRYHNHFDRSIDISIAEAHQEVATRQVSDEMLAENELILGDLLRSYGKDDTQCLNLLGLLYRRFGERKSVGDRRIPYLEQAMKTFLAIQRLEGDRMSVETKNNWAITLIRHFELTKDAASLDTAEALLESIDYRAQVLPLPDFLALPKALNNRGNIFKQRMAHSGDVHCYPAAIEQYSRTERFWDEAGSPYEWAMIQKNKADVRCEYMTIAGFHRSTADTALREIELSLKYRTEENAPYQYQRSLEVKRRLEKMLSD